MNPRPTRQTFSGETWVNRKIMRPLAQEILLLIWNSPITPNSISISRIVLVLPLGILIYQGTLQSTLFALATFFFMEVLDHLDGMLARKKNLSSRRGQFIEVISDEISASPNFILGFYVLISFYSFELLTSLLFSISAERLFLFIKYNASVETKQIEEITHDDEDAPKIRSVSDLISELIRFLFIWKPIILMFCIVLAVSVTPRTVLNVYYYCLTCVWVLMSIKHIASTWKVL
jgi:phosphatidylglycerophosphate synthase